MRKFFLALMLLPMLMLSMSLNVRAEAIDRAVIAVLPLTNKAQHLEGMQYYDAMEMAAYLIDALKDTKRFRLVELDQLESVVNVQVYNSGQLTSTGGQMSLGSMLKAQYVVIGSILGEGTKTSELTYENSALGSAGGEKYKVETSVAIRIVDVSTGEIMFSAIGKGKSESTGIEVAYDSGATMHVITIGGREVSSTQFVNAVENALDKAVFDKDRGLIAKMDGTDKRSKGRR
ncbi:MAG: hypothetical protein IJU71_03105 [Selenomonadaceae bacterium]|nr:hypothetical protein [Selenomonadaceae bacterium]